MSVLRQRNNAEIKILQLCWQREKSELACYSESRHRVYIFSAKHKKYTMKSLILAQDER